MTAHSRNTESVDDTGKVALLPWTRFALRWSGWRPGQRVDSTFFRVSLEEAGYIFRPSAAAMLQEFGGIAVALDCSWSKIVLMRWVSMNQFWIGLDERRTLDPEMTMAQFRNPPLPMAEYERRVGCGLTPIGGLPSRWWYLLVGENNSVYAVDQKRIAVVGESAVAAINRLVYSRDFMREVD